MRWAWAAAVVLLWPQLVHLGGIAAQREPKRPRQPGQRSESPNATVANSEGPPGSPKVRWGRAHVGAWTHPASPCTPAPAPFTSW